MPQDEGAGHEVYEEAATTTSGWFSAYHEAALNTLASSHNNMLRVAEENAIR